VNGGQELLYLTDAYAAEVATAVVSAAERAVALRQTPFYPGGGGLPPDGGRLRWDGGEARVISHHREEDWLWHDLDGSAPAPGTPAHAVLDWSVRYGVMRYHTAVHVLSGVVYHLFQATVTGGQIYPDRARMDFALEDLNPQRVAAIVETANRVIGEGRDILVRFVTREEFARLDLVRTAKNLVPAHLTTIRVVEIAGFDAQADGGVHVRNTGEIGALRVVKTENKGKINRRLEIALTASSAST
jgi:Ser-tRNA(Ala) deacylase AlaX